jgi:hypothetical protein
MIVSPIVRSFAICSLLQSSISGYLSNHIASSISSNNTNRRVDHFGYFTKLSLRTTTTSSSMETINSYPELVAFDLDACFWDQEMFEMPSIPTVKKTLVSM